MPCVCTRAICIDAFDRNFKYADVHVAGAERIARVAADVGVQRLVHVSHLNASPDSKSVLYRTKYEGEELVKSVFPSATIVRPAAMFGYEDKLLNNMASKHSFKVWRTMPFLTII